MRWVIDSSVLVKLIINEPGSDEAREFAGSLMDKNAMLYTVDFAFAECLSALYKHVVIHGDLPEVDAKSAAEDLHGLGGKIKILNSRDVINRGIDISLSLNLSAYDSLFIAAAQGIDATIWTADVKLHTAALKLLPSELLKARSSKQTS